MYRLLVWMLLAASASAQQAPVSVRDAVFPAEVDPARNFEISRRFDGERRPIFVFLDDVPGSGARFSEAGPTYALAREAYFRAVRPGAVVDARPAHLFIEDNLPCRLLPVKQVIVVPGAEGDAPTAALQMEGCPTPGNWYAGLAVLGTFQEARWIKQVHTQSPPVLVLQKIPKGMRPDSVVAKSVIPEMNRQRIAQHEADLRYAQSKGRAAAAAAKARGGMLDDDARLRKFISAAAADARTNEFKPVLYIVAGKPYVYFTDGYERSFLMSFDGKGKSRFEGL